MVVKINMKDCLKCYACMNTCPNDAIKETDDGPVIDAEKCTGCGECKEVCPANCIE